MTSPVRMVPDRVSRETVAALEQLLAMAKRTNSPLRGLAFAAMVTGRGKGRQCFTNATGAMYHDPVFARGAVADLHDALGELARGKTPPGWEP